MSALVLVLLIALLVTAASFAQKRGTEPLRQAPTVAIGIAGGEGEIDISQGLTGNMVELFGHVTLVQGYARPNFVGCHALIALRDTPGKTIAVLTSEHRLQTLLESGLATGNLVAVWARKYTDPPSPRGGTWNTDVYYIDGVILYD